MEPHSDVGSRAWMKQELYSLLAAFTACFYYYMDIKLPLSTRMMVVSLTTGIRHLFNRDVATPAIAMSFIVLLNFLPSQPCLLYYLGLLYLVDHVREWRVYRTLDGPRELTAQNLVLAQASTMGYLATAGPLAAREFSFSTDLFQKPASFAWISLRTWPFAIFLLLFTYAKLMNSAIVPLRLRMAMNNSFSSGVTRILQKIVDTQEICGTYAYRGLSRLLQQCLAHLQWEFAGWKTMSEFEYSPLDEGHVRFLVLHRTRWWWPGAVEAHVVHASLPSAPRYEAISYRWAKVERRNKITIDNRYLYVTESALECLLSRRSVWHERTIWIDAICIDQKKPDEKAGQIKLMRHIYRGASRVIAFAEDDRTASLGVTLFYELLGGMYQLGDQVWKSWMMDHRTRDSARWRALDSLLTNKYFNRLWVLEEIALGQDVQLFYGGRYIPWNLYYETAAKIWHSQRQFTYAIESRERQALFGGSGFDNIATMELLRPAGSTREDTSVLHRDFDGLPSEDRTLANLLLATDKFEAHDDQDRVYAVLGLLHEESDADFLKRNYKTPPEQLFTLVARHLLLEQAEPAIDILALAGTAFRCKDGTLPSWVPDLRERRLSWKYTEVICSDRFSASSLMPRPVVQSGYLPDTLQVQAVICDQILDICPVWQLRDPCSGEVLGSKQLMTFKKEYVTKIIKMSNKYEGVWPSGTHIIRKHLPLAMIAERLDGKIVTEMGMYEILFSDWYNIVCMSHDDIVDNGGLHKTVIATWSGWDNQPVDRVNAYNNSVCEAGYGRRFAITRGGRLSWIPPGVKKADLICVFHGAQAPYVVTPRPLHGGAATYELLGEAYVHGLMKGEAVHDTVNAHPKTLTLV